MQKECKNFYCSIQNYLYKIQGKIKVHVLIQPTIPNLIQG